MSHNDDESIKKEIPDLPSERFAAEWREEESALYRLFSAAASRCFRFFWHLRRGDAFSRRRILNLNSFLKRLLKSLMHVLMVWENRNVFPAEYVKGLRGALFAEQRKHLEMCIEVSVIYFLL